VQDKDYKLTAEESSKVNFLGKSTAVLKITLTALEDSNYVTGSTKTLNVTIVKRSLTNRICTKITVGEAKLTVAGAQPAVTVVYNGETLTAGTDYTLTYKNNTKFGTGQVIITGAGNYSGKRTVKFQITN
jgi:uncharacterized protein YdaL